MTKSNADLCRELEASCERMRQVNKLASENRIRQDLSEPAVERSPAASTVYTGAPGAKGDGSDKT